MRAYQDELAMTVSKQYAEAGGHRDNKITTLQFEKIKDNKKNNGGGGGGGENVSFEFTPFIPNEYES